MKPDCYKCIHRGNVAGDAHSCCNHPATQKVNENPLMHALNWLATVQAMNPSLVPNELGVTANLHGVRQGWFLWPMNFDPVWLETCNGFEEKKDA